MNPERIKICGLTTRQAVTACNESGCGFAGFIAHPSSPRHLAPEAMRHVRSSLNASIRAVLVTVNAGDDTLDSYIKAASPDMLQLHGSETPSRCLELSARYHLPIIKAFGIATPDDLLIIRSYEDSADILLLDSKRSDGSSGGAGSIFDWPVLRDFITPLPWFLSGGIGIRNIDEAMQEVHPPFIDISSSLELEKGIKDPEKIRGFMNHIALL